MPSDRARRSYDPSRMYRSVVSQQGRVTLEADTNEAEEIRAGESRAEVAEIVGRAGSPDDGFKISLPGKGAYDFAIGKGSMYVGGVRVVAALQTTYAAQKSTEWVDFPAGAPATYSGTKTPASELVYLAVTEQEVGAVEDAVLREIALGGPDSSARTRMIQRVHRAALTAADCEDALAEVVRTSMPGLAFDEATMRLASAARLKVDFVPVPGTADPCTPTAHEGFLGAENQLIRLQVSADGALLWGYDNASFLYRAAIDSTKRKRLALTGIPVDVFHQPQGGQWVEVLASAVSLGDGSYVAASVGTAAEINSYDATANVITLKTDLPNELFTNAPPAVFVRVWEKRLPFAGNGTTATDVLDRRDNSTGLRVYTKGPAAPGDHWMIGVRPSAPTSILPARIAADFQPPDGPARWATPLATIKWTDNSTGTVHDCRPPFDTLVELTRQKCCEIKVHPGDDVQKIIDKQLEWMKARSVSTLHLRFAPGTFTLENALTIRGPNGGELTVSGCGSALVAARRESALVILDWDSVAVTDLRVEAGVARPGKGKLQHLNGALTILNCASSTVERLVAASGTGNLRAASCLKIWNKEDRSATARVRSCVFQPGARQVGALLVNVDRAMVEDNEVRLNPPASAHIPQHALKRLLIHRPRLGGESISGVRYPLREERKDLRNDIAIHYATVARLANAWSAVFDWYDQDSTWTELTNDEQRSFQRLIERIVRQILARQSAGPLSVELLYPFLQWMEVALKSEAFLASAGQAIVIGGVRAQDIRILNNTITDVMDGIHIGLSRHDPSREHPLFADRVQVTGNTVSLRIPWYERGAHVGIFVGNVQAATIRDNQVHIEERGDDSFDLTHMEMRAWVADNRKGWPENLRGEAIRVWGVPGRMLLVSGNTSAHAEVGVRVHHVGNAESESLFRVTQNLAIDANSPIFVNGTVVVADDNVPMP